MALSSINSGNSGIMAQARMNVRGRGQDIAAEAAVSELHSSTTGMKAGSLSEPAPASASALQTAAPASNMMADFFVKNTMQQSKYIKATLNGLDLAAQMREHLKAESFTLLDAAGGLFGAPSSGFGSEYTDAVLNKHAVDKLARDDKEKETLKSSERNLEETRDDIDQAAEEATQGKTGTDAAEAGNGTPKEAANSGAADAASAEGATGEGADSAGKAEESDAVAAPADALLKGSENGTGDTVVEAVERFQTANVVQQASTVGEVSQEPTVVLAAAAASAQGASSGGTSFLGSRVDMLV